MSDRPSAARRARGTVPAWMAPQLAKLTSVAPDGDDWIHEIKYDGYRLLAWVDGGSVRLLTRNRKDWSARFPKIVAALARLGLGGAVLDGEAAVELGDGRTSFQALQNALRDPSQGRLRFLVFDALYVDGEDLRGLPLTSRKTRLESELANVTSHDVEGVIRYSEHVVGHGPAFLEEACRHGLEGIISKHAQSPYGSGRSRSWLKVKCVREQEFVIGGYTDPAGSRQGLGALHVGTYDAAGRLVYRGKVGTGFTAAVLHDLRARLEGLERPQSPFDGGPTRGAARNSHWVEPSLVAQVRYTEITTDGLLRHPAYQGLREDKPARDVKLESPDDPETAIESSSERASRDDDAAHARRQTGAARAADDDPVAGDGGARAPMTRSRKSAGSPVEVAGARLTSPARVVYPERGVTKLDLARYYEAMADWVLPHIAGRPLTLVRCPAGQQGHCFFQKHMDESAPAEIKRVLVEERDGAEWYGTVQTPAGLVSLVQLGALELHTWNSRSDRLERPDRFVIDLDPDPSVDWSAVVDAALHIRDLLDELGLESFLKTTGGKGLHVVVPLVRRAGWDEVKAFSQAVASLLATAAPQLYTTELSKRKRRGRILLDYLRNARGATAIEAYSTRARAGAPVAAPIHWDELGDGVRADSFNVGNMPSRMAELGEDPWNGIGAVKQSLTAPMKRRLGL